MPSSAGWLTGARTVGHGRALGRGMVGAGRRAGARPGPRRTPPARGLAVHREGSRLAAPEWGPPAGHPGRARAVATPYDKTAAGFLGTLHLAASLD